MLTYQQRAELCSHPLAKKLFQIMEEKKTNIAVAADLTHMSEILSLADLIGPEICCLKTHVDIISDFSLSGIQELKKIAERHHFLLFEDRKFADIGNTVRLQYQKGIYHISDWADIVNAHSLPGDGIINGLKEVGLPKNRALLMLAEMSAKGTLTDSAYAKKTVEMALKHPDFVIGFIAQNKLCDQPHLIHMTPGINLQEGGDGRGQNYNTPETAIRNGSDILIIGRAIVEAPNPLEMAKIFKSRGWEAYAKQP